MKLQRILIVEDELIVAKHIEKQLMKSGYEVTSIVNNGKSALKEVKNNPPDLILMDVNIEGDIDGIETSMLINKENRIPIVYLTAFTEKNTIDRAKETDPYGYTIKPFSSKNLETTIEIAYHKFRIEKKLRDSESWLVNTMNNLADAVITTEPDGRIKYLNPVAEELTGWTYEQARGKNLEDILVLFNEADRKPIINIVDRILSAPNKDYLYSLLKSKKGKEIIIGLKAEYIKEDNNENIGIVTVFQDFTDQRLQELSLLKSQKVLQDKIEENKKEINTISRDLKSSEDKYKTFIENVFDLVCEVNIDGSFCFVNNNYKKLFTYSEDDLLGSTVFDYIHDEDLHDFKDSFTSAVENDAGFSCTYRSNTKDGELIWLQSTGKKVLDSQGNASILIASRDITENKRFEEQRIKADRLEFLGLFAGGIAHDFNNLITIILGNISLISENKEFEGEISAQVEAIEKASNRARELTIQLTTFSKGGEPNKKVIDDLDSIILDTTRFALSGSKVKYNFNLDSDIWKISADASQIAQVIGNLVINSKQAMSGDGALDIMLENDAHKDSHGSNNDMKYIKITIRDSGGGIKPEHINKIFDPYFTTKKAGTGLGLATCYTIVKTHGGFIEVDSDVGVGTSFYVYLPAVESESTDSIQDAQNDVISRTTDNIKTDSKPLLN